MKPKDKVVCINSTFNHPNTSRDFQNLPQLGEIYTVREYKFEPENNTGRVILEEIRNKPIYSDLYFGYVEPGFDAKRFVPIEVFDNLEEFANEMTLLNS